MQVNIPYMDAMEDCFFGCRLISIKFRGVIGVDDWSTYLGFPAGTIGLFHPFTRMNPLPKRDEQEKKILQIVPKYQQEIPVFWVTWHFLRAGG